MKNYLLLIIVTITFISILSSCRQDDSMLESTAEDIMYDNKKSSETSKKDSMESLIISTDPPVKDGQQWRFKK